MTASYQKTALAALSLVSVFLAACTGAPAVPEYPTWADVAPILQGECNHCHGSTAHVTASQGPATYRFDFFDMNDAVCGDAAAAMDVPALAAASAGLIKRDITPFGGGRPRMPPAPGPVLQDWERETISRWADAPIKGPPSPDNRRPTIVVNHLPSSAKNQVSFVATTDDPDNDSVIGVITLDNMVFRMTHAGSFTVQFDLSGMTAGTYRINTVLCDGWGSREIDLGPIDVLK
jgi:hypothetical protein